jgi:hypothetical protein
MNFLTIRDMTKAKPKYGANGVRPSGRVLIHNHVRRYDVMKPGVNGFRTWYDYLTGPYSLDLRLLGLRHSEPPPALSSACRRSSRLRKTADPRSSAAAQIVHVLREQF